MFKSFRQGSVHPFMSNLQINIGVFWRNGDSNSGCSGEMYGMSRTEQELVEYINTVGR